MKLRTIQLHEEELFAISHAVRQSVFEICLAANSGHIGGSSGAVELLTTLYFGGILHYQTGDVPNSQRDRILIRGHLGPVRYKIFSLLGYLEESELPDYRRFGSRLHGHEDYLETPGVDITPSGSLGMLLSYGVGCAYAAKHTGSDYATYVFLGDGEEQEGNISEAARHASHLCLDNLIVIVDKNTKQLSNPTKDTDSSDLPLIWKGYGWQVVVLKDGHDINSVRAAYIRAGDLVREAKKPVMILAHTDKGNGLEGFKKHFSGYHTISTCTPEIVRAAIERMKSEGVSLAGSLVSAKKKIDSFKEKINLSGGTGDSCFVPLKMDVQPLLTTPPNPDASQIDYFRTVSDKVTMGELRVKPMFFLTADVTRKDHVDQLGLEQFCTFFNTGLREQHTIAMAHGLSLTLPSSRILINTIDAFTYRSLDQVNAAAQGKSSMVIIGDVSGLTNSKNGRTHQSSGQPGALLMMPGVTFLEPWDVKDTFNCLNWAIGESRGVIFIRIHSSTIKPIQVSESVRNIDWYIVHEPPSQPDMAIVASGLTVGQAFQAAVILEKEGVMVRVFNLINHKSLKESFARVIPGRKPLLTVYNGHENVLKANVASVIMEYGCCIPSKIHGLGFDFGTTGDTENLLKAYRLDAEGIVQAIKNKIL